MAIAKNSLLPKEVIVIDNNSLKSPDKHINSLNLNMIINIKYLRNKKNLGFATAVNQGVKVANQKYIMFLNPDLFLEKDALSKIWKQLKTEKNIVGGKIVEMNGQAIKKTIANLPSFLTLLIEFTSLRKVFDRIGLPNLSNFWSRSVASLKTPSLVDSLSGCLMAINKSDFVKIGKFDEKFFMYLEDLDLFIRANHLGFSTIYIPETLGKHYEGGSSMMLPNKIDNQAWQKSKRYFTRKHFGLWGKALNVIFDIDDKLLTIYKKLK